MIETIGERKCFKCRIIKPSADFYRNRLRKDGTSIECKTCAKIRVKRWSKLNPEKRRLSHNLWVEKNRHKVREYDRRYSLKHPDRSKLQKRRWALLHPDIVANKQLIANYGITLEQYNELLAKQKGICAICKEPSPNGKRLCVDHCHKTGKVRGLLCDICNKGVGHFRDNSEYLRAAINYLKFYDTDNR